MVAIEELSPSNYKYIALLAFALWPDSTLEAEEEFFKTCLEDRTQTAFLLKADQQPVGFVSLSLRQEYVEGTQSKPVCYVEGIYVIPDFRHNGFGQLLMEHAAAWGKEMGCTEMASDTEIGNSESIQFHKSLGFREVNRVVCFVKKIS